MPYNFIHDSFHTGVKAEALRAKIERKSAISHQPIFARLVKPMNALQLFR